ncbi:AAA family ATPase [Halanaerobacter jeridensis]|uniref:MoxR-like ATPase n=1 Tax=Halanaerobacter jeridensis TaxID=706427 RepID=A0A938XY10_9FIRM|nr:MoxR family ATPase [Halanaerobacter jeridensis]MBM7557370.1 MoxR-like ATPase [Halanaerobacter jeridensis]
MSDFDKICEEILDNMEEVMVGKREVLEEALICFLAGGHLLLEDVPGVGKTMLARSLAVSSGAEFSRVQCTPDLLPKDMTGITVYHQETEEFEFSPGPIFSQVLLVDEINRATPKTQSGLLESMAEGQVSIDGATKILPQPFFVIATQNPVEFDGTFPLPKAQLDRFMMKTSMGYPGQEDEVQILKQVKKKHPIKSLESVTTPEKIEELKKEVRQVHVADKVAEYLVKIVAKTREHPDIVLGASPRGSIDLYHTAQAKALLEGRNFVTPQDVKSLAPSVLSHRLVVKSESQLRGTEAVNLIAKILKKVSVPVLQEE